MNSILKRKCTKDQHQIRKLYDTKARNNQNKKSTTRSNDIYGITWLKTKLDMIQKLKDTTQIVTSERKLKVNSRKDNAIPKEQPYS